jgi:hypothetical protein
MKLKIFHEEGKEVQSNILSTKAYYQNIVRLKSPPNIFQMKYHFFDPFMGFRSNVL